MLKTLPKNHWVLLGMLLPTFMGLSTAQAATAPPMGTSANFGVLAGSQVSNTGNTNVVGELGVFPGSPIIGFPPGTVFAGTTHSADVVAQQAQTDLTAAYIDLAGQPFTADLSGQDLGGLTLTTGVYSFSSSAQLTGTLTLDAQGVPGAVFIFQIASALTTASSSSVRVINGGSECNVYWQVGSSATLGTTTSFAGNILALTSISLTTGATVAGRVLARNSFVSLDTNNIAACLACSPTTLSPATLPNGTTAVAYNQVITASGATAPYTFDVVGGALPTGLTLAVNGTLAGTPTLPGSYTFTVSATDSAGCYGVRAYTVVVNAAGCPAISLAPAVLPAAIAATAYSQTITASGGAAPYAFSISAGSLPPGLSLASSSATTALVSGTPSSPGNYNFTVTATDSASCAGSHIYTIVEGTTGGSTGDPHMRSLDGLGFEFQACGDYVLSTTASRGFEVQVRQVPWGGENQYSVNSAVAVKAGEHSVVIAPFQAACHMEAGYPEGCVMVDGVTAPFACARDDQAVGCKRSMQLADIGDIQEDVSQVDVSKQLAVGCQSNYLLRLATGEQVYVCVQSGYLNLWVVVPVARRSQTMGVLGNADGNPHNDFQVRNGATMGLSPYFDEFYGSFAESWRVPVAEVMFDPAPLDSPRCPAHPPVAEDIPADVRTHAVDVCHNAGVDPSMLDACVTDVALMGGHAAYGFVGIGPPRAVATLRSRDSSAPAAAGCGCLASAGSPTGALLGMGLAACALMIRRRKVTAN